MVREVSSHDPMLIVLSLYVSRLEGNLRKAFDVQDLRTFDGRSYFCAPPGGDVRIEHPQFASVDAQHHAWIGGEVHCPVGNRCFDFVVMLEG